jgi:hypothetical protein
MEHEFDRNFWHGMGYDKFVELLDSIPDSEFAHIHEAIEKAIANNPKKISLQDAQKQIELFMKDKK